VRFPPVELCAFEELFGGVVKAALDQPTLFGECRFDKLALQVKEARALRARALNPELACLIELGHGAKVLGRCGPWRTVAA
jgi:hypothetical protein